MQSRSILAYNPLHFVNKFGSDSNDSQVKVPAFNNHSEFLVELFLQDSACSYENDPHLLSQLPQVILSVQFSLFRSLFFENVPSF